MNIFAAGISTHTARELAIDAVIERLSAEEMKDGTTIVRDAELPERAVIITESALYIIHAHNRTRTANITATHFGNQNYAHDRIGF